MTQCATMSDAREFPAMKQRQSLEQQKLAEITRNRVELVEDYPELCARMIRQWNRPRNSDAVWLLYAANYLFNTHGVRWAVDPVMLKHQLPEAPSINPAGSLANLSFVLLTHAHVDHVDVSLWRALRKSDCRWIVPEHMSDFFMEKTLLAPSQFITARPSSIIDIDGVRITPFDGLHFERKIRTVGARTPATGYLVETRNKRYLLPGDIRTYANGLLPSFGPVDAVFAHVFLGRKAALQDDPPLLDAFADFLLELRPGQILLTHLYELGRSPANAWRLEHTAMIKRCLQKTNPNIKIVVPEWYEETLL